MRLKNFRDILVEVKLYFVRTSTYLSIINFLMIVLIFFNTTLWDYDFIRNMFPDRKFFLLTGLAFVLVATVILGYVDTKLKIWRTETERSYMPERNPFLIPLAFESAKHLADLKADGKDVSAVENELDRIFDRCGMHREFTLFKDTASGTGKAKASPPQAMQNF